MSETATFKVGDRVRVVGNGSFCGADGIYHSLESGTEATVRRAEDGGWAFVEALNGLRQYVSAHHIELIPPKTGDEVELTVRGTLRVFEDGSARIVSLDAAYISLCNISSVKVITPAEPEVSPIEAALAALPPSADEIAIVLGRLGIGGDHKFESCPIASYLKDETGEEVCVVGSKTVRGGMVTIPNPQHIADFVLKFDGGDYPWLDES